MEHINFNYDDLRDKIYGCWTGKNIGGTLGAPFEGQNKILDVTGYTNATGEPLPNDDLDLQLVWLKAAQEQGPKALNARVLGEYWLNYVPPYWNEYGIGKVNMRAGMQPPISGMYANEVWRNSNGAWIRTEIWACLAPGCPDLAVKYAYEDACVDHGNGEGTFAAMFVAAVESAAFVISDRDELIKIGLSKIPLDCRVAKSIKMALDCYEKGIDWKEARTMIAKDSEDIGYFQAPANVAYAMLGWVYGEGDFGKSMLTAVNCGDDTDCSAATLGSILGIIRGRKSIPVEWIEPIGDRIITMALDKGSMQPPPTCDNLTDQVMDLLPTWLASAPTNVRVSCAPTDTSKASEFNYTDNSAAKILWARSGYDVVYDFTHTRVVLDYGKDPVLKIGEPFELTLTLTNLMPDSRHLELIWHLPDGIKALPGNRHHAYIAHSDLYGPGKPSIMKIQISADDLSSARIRGSLEILAEGRPTVGYVPLLFIAG